MRYVSLKKRNSSKTSYLTKRIIATSYIVLRIASLLLIPLYQKDSQVNAKTEYDIVDISNDNYNDSNEVNANNSLTNN